MNKVFGFNNNIGNYAIEFANLDIAINYFKDLHSDNKWAELLICPKNEEQYDQALTVFKDKGFEVIVYV